MLLGHDRRQFPIAKMRSEAEGRSMVVLQFGKDVFVVGDDTAAVGTFGMIVPEPCEMNVFPRDPAEILPGATQRRFNPVIILIWEGRVQVGTANAM